MDQAPVTVDLANPIPLPLEQLVPGPSLFSHRSTLHGLAHVSRVMVHAFLLIDLLGFRDAAPALWAAVYLHDLGRTDDGVSPGHGAEAVRKLDSLPQVRELFKQGGVKQEDYEAVVVAVTWHSLGDELPKDRPHWRLTALLKDADGLDRVRLGDVDARYFRFPLTGELIPFAEGLFVCTHPLPPGPGYFANLWKAAQSVWKECKPGLRWSN